MDLFGEPISRHVEVGLHKKLTRSKRRVGALAAECLNTVESGKQIRQESVKQWIVGPMRRFGELGDHGSKGSKLRAEDLPSRCEGIDTKCGR